MDRIDFIAQNKQLYSPKTEPELIEVPPMRYLMYDGYGTPETSPEFQKAMQALYGIAYSIKFMPKKGKMPRGWRDFKVPPPEGLWWMRNGQAFDASQPEEWGWTLMLRVPDFVSFELVDQVATELVKKKHEEAYARVYIEEYREGPSVQLMHIGPYESEAADIAKMDAFASAHGYRYHGKHHEIYFGDPRRTKPEKLKTVLRHPVVLNG